MQSKQLAYYYRHKEKILAKNKAVRAANAKPKPVKPIKPTWDEVCAAELLKDKYCKVCGSAFHSKYATTVYCGGKCRNAGHYKKKPKTEFSCIGCGKNFLRPYRNELYCSVGCRTKSSVKREAERLKDPEFLAAIRIKRNNYCKQRRLKDPKYRLLGIIRGSLVSALKKQRQKKNTRTAKLLGCSLEFAKKHIESQFKDGMNWQNMGRHGWHIDHIRPCASFDLSDPSQQAICFHWSNLQPLWASENLSKRHTWEDENLMIA